MAAKKKARVSAAKRRAGIPQAEKLFMISRTFPGAQYAGVPHERGRIIRLRGLVKDQDLLRIRYIEEIADPSLIDIAECGGCGGQFISQFERDNHFKRAHKDILRAREQTIHDLTEKQRAQLMKKTGTFGPEDVGFMPQATPQDLEEENIIKREDEISPIRYDQTKASRA